MTEIIIVSPKGKEASLFTKFFDEDIVISKNSKIYLNHATLTKNEGVNFVDQQTLTFNITQENVYGDLETGLTLDVDIPEGNYKYSDLRLLIEKNVSTMLTQTDNAKALSSYKSLNAKNIETERDFF